MGSRVGHFHKSGFRFRKPGTETLSPKITGLLLFFAILVFFSGCRKGEDWVSYRGNQGSGYTSDSIFPPLGTKWNLRLQAATETIAGSFNPPVVKDDSIYFGSSDGNFYSLNVNSGYMNWIFKTDAAVNSIPFADEENVYFGSNDGKVYVINRKTGEKVWSYNTGNTVQSLVLRYGDHIIFTSDTGSTYFLDPEGRLEHSIPNPVWSHHTFQVYDGVVYWAPLGRNFGAYDIEQRTFLWTVSVNVPFAVWYSFPALDENNVYFASSFLTGGPPELRYYGMNRKTGERVWEQVDAMNPGEHTPWNRDTLFLKHIDLLDYLAPSLWKNLVIYTSGDTLIRAFDKETGEPAWTRSLKYPTSSAPTVAGDRIYFGMRGSSFGYDSEESGVGEPPRLVCIAAENGDLLWSMETDGAVLSAPLIAGGRIIFGTENHRFYVLEEVF